RARSLGHAENDTVTFLVLVSKSATPEIMILKKGESLNIGWLKGDTQQQEQAKKESKCFIATAAYGSDLAAEVQSLRRFRDQRLNHSKEGRLFIKIYEILGSPPAKLVRRSRILQFVVRKLVSFVCSNLRWFEKQT
ncbi:hypothetical protein L0222_00625, partial [bacterium]|nr:hypothetical protein [bacterium]